MPDHLEAKSGEAAHTVPHVGGSLTRRAPPYPPANSGASRQNHDDQNHFWFVVY